MKTVTTDPAKISELEQLKGTFENGMDADDVNQVGKVLADTLNRKVVCIWDFDDMWGPGGNNCLYEERGHDQFFDLAESLHDFLYEPESTVSAQDLIDNYPEVEAATIDQITPEIFDDLDDEERETYSPDLSPIYISEHNYALRQSHERELG